MLDDAALAVSDNGTRSLRSGFLRTAERHSGRPALAIGTRTMTYAQLREQAAEIAATLGDLASGSEPPAPHALGAPSVARGVTAVFGHRSFAAFAGVLGILFHGDGYVPLNPRFPAKRTANMLLRSSAETVIVESQSIGLFVEVLQCLEVELTVLIPDAEDVSELARRFPAHSFYSKAGLRHASMWRAKSVGKDEIACLLFTSGSTGQPKGVVVPHRSVLHFLDFVVQRYQVNESDRLSHNFDLTFDLSLFDMFVSWQAGACLCVPTSAQLLFPDKYIASQGLTIWFSVPSTVALMSKLRMLRQGRFETLRYSLFCGEALPLESAQAFAEASPNSVVENLYGPTELTIACTWYRYESERAARESISGVVPIGSPNPGMCALVVDEHLGEVLPGTPGELLMSGPQLTLGYWRDEESTKAAFVVPPGRNRCYYRTGDRVVQRQAGGPFVYLGRTDNQIKIRGYRVELDEVESVLRSVTTGGTAVCLGFPAGPSGADGIVAFISAHAADLAKVRDAAKNQLPPYMQPDAVFQIDEFPLNINGKIDRRVLLERLSTGEFTV